MERYGSKSVARSILAALVILLVAGLAAPVAVSAQGTAWAEFGSQSHEVDFGEEITFELEARTQRALAQAWLVYRMDGERARTRAPAEPAGRGRWAYTWEIEAGMMAPGATITYYWELEDENGQRLAGPEGTFSYDDARRDWRSLSADGLTVFYYSDEAQAQSILEAGIAALHRIADNTGMEALRPIRMYIYASQRDMVGVIPQRSESFDARTVTLGMSMGADGLVLLGSDRGVRETTAHELSHVVVHQNTDSPFANLPRWLDEGLSMFSEGQMPRDNQSALDRAMRADRLITLRSMTSYPGDPALVDLFYGQAASIVSFMIEQQGPESMKALLAELAMGRSIDAALQTSYGMTLDELEAAWRSSLGVGTSRSRSGFDR